MTAQLEKGILLLGQQTFDGLGRQLRVVVGGRTTQFEYQAGQLPPRANVLPDDSRVDFTYESNLDNQILSICPAGEADNTFAYGASLGLISSARGVLGEHLLAYTPSGLPRTDTWKIDEKEYVTTWRYALGGLLLGFDDAQGVTHARHYDGCGRPDQVTVNGVTLDMTYDEFDRPESLTCADSGSGSTLMQTLTYDGLGREQTRSFTLELGGVAHSFIQTLGYSALDQLIARQWRDGDQVGEESFA